MITHFRWTGLHGISRAILFWMSQNNTKIYAKETNNHSNMRYSERNEMVKNSDVTETGMLWGQATAQSIKSCAVWMYDECKVQYTHTHARAHAHAHIVDVWNSLYRHTDLSQMSNVSLEELIRILVVLRCLHSWLSVNYKSIFSQRQIKVKPKEFSR